MPLNRRIRDKDGNQVFNYTLDVGRGGKYEHDEEKNES